MDKEDTLVNKLPCGVKEVSPDMRPALFAFRYNVTLFLLEISKFLELMFLRQTDMISQFI